MWKVLIGWVSWSMLRVGSPIKNCNTDMILKKCISNLINYFFLNMFVELELPFCILIMQCCFMYCFYCSKYNTPDFSYLKVTVIVIFIESYQKDFCQHLWVVDFKFGLTHQAFPLLLDGVPVGVGLDALDSTLASLLAMANIFLCFWDSLAGTGECLMLVLTLQAGGKISVSWSIQQWRHKVVLCGETAFLQTWTK